MRLDDTEADVMDMFPAMQKGMARADALGSWLKQFYVAVKKLLFASIVLLALPMDVVLHHRFGVRALTAPVIAMLVAVVYGMGRLFARSYEDGLVIYVTVGFTCIALTHAVLAHIRQRRGIPWHSRSAGMPYAFWSGLPGGKSPITVMRFHEPIAVILAGIVLSPFTGLGPLVSLMGYALFARRWMEWHELRGDILDQLDAQLEAEIMQDFVKGERGSWDTAGYVVPPVEMFKNLTPAASAEDALKSVEGMLDTPEVEIVSKPSEQQREVT